MPMPHTVVDGILVAAGLLAMSIAVFNERRMQRHRQPGITYRDVTFRRDGAWRNPSLFTDEGLRYQRRASTWGVIGAAFWIGALLAWLLLS